MRAQKKRMAAKTEAARWGKRAKVDDGKDKTKQKGGPEEHPLRQPTTAPPATITCWEMVGSCSDRSRTPPICTFNMSLQW